MCACVCKEINVDICMYVYLCACVRNGVSQRPPGSCEGNHDIKFIVPGCRQIDGKKTICVVQREMESFYGAWTKGFEWGNRVMCLYMLRESGSPGEEM